jgi:photosystem II stability/assembly factor-like uncharacterized protein
MQKTLFAQAVIGCLLLTFAIPAAADRNRFTGNGVAGVETSGPDSATEDAVPSSGAPHRGAPANRGRASLRANTGVGELSASRGAATPRVTAATGEGPYATTRTIGLQDDPAARRTLAASVTEVAIADNEDVYVIAERELFRSHDRGGSWTRVSGIGTAFGVATAGSNVYVIVPLPNVGRSEVHESSDGGQTWTRAYSGLGGPYSVVGARSSSSIIYADFGMPLTRSTDGGRTWADISPEALRGCGWEFCGEVAVDSADPEKVYYGYMSLYGSQDGGGEWTRLLGRDSHWQTTFSALAAREAVLQAALVCSDSIHSYARIFGCGITTSVDGGISWSAPRLSDEIIRTIAIDPRSPWRSYAGTASGRIYRSDDFGNQWTLFSDGHASPVRKLAVNNLGDRVYAGTNSGLFVYEITAELQFEMLPADPQRLPRLLDQLLALQIGGPRPISTSGLLIPAAGHVRGSGGATFHTDLTLVNARATDQDVLVAWLPQGNSAGADVSMFRLTLRAASRNDDRAMTFDDLAEELGLDGLGSMLLFAVDSSGNLDSRAQIDGFARIRSRSECGGWVSQSLAAVPAGEFTTSQRSRVSGLRHESSYRTNVGVVNLSASARTFTVIAKGEGVSEQFTITVPPFAPILAPLPKRNYGAVSLTVIGDGTSVPSVSYGSSVDNSSGDAWAAVAVPRPTP